MAGMRQQANRGIGLMVGLLVVGLLAAILLPVILTEFADVETTEWDGTWETLFDLIPIFIILGAALYFVFSALDR